MIPGAVLFARYAYPPNALGYCGPDAAGELLARAEAGADSPGLRRLARGFEGAWPYLELIAHANGLADPLDRSVVEAYWVGNRLLDAVTPALLHSSLEGRFRPRLGLGDFAALADEAGGSGARPHHAFHVFGVYPWVGLLRGGRVDEPLRVLDRCRIRWGRVVEADAGRALVASRPLTWDGGALSLGAPRVEEVRCPPALGAGPEALRPGEWCSLHWDWLCDRLGPAGVRALRRHTAAQLDAVNAPASGRPVHARPALAPLEGAAR